MHALRKITLKNFLSFRDLELKIAPLNVLVGANGSGKSNILKSFQFIGLVARNDLRFAIDSFGGFENIYFRSELPSGSLAPRVEIKIEGVLSENASETAQDVYKLSFYSRRNPTTADRDDQSKEILVRNEQISIKRTKGRGRRITISGSHLQVQQVSKGKNNVNMPKFAPLQLRIQDDATGLATIRKLGQEYEAPGVESIAAFFDELRLFEVNVQKMERQLPIRLANRLSSDGANISRFLHSMHSDFPDIYEQICSDVNAVYPSFRGFRFIPIEEYPGSFSVEMIESRLTGGTPLSSLSFGTKRAIALFAMLNDPAPPRLTCLEEVDHGLHPQALDRLIERVRSASERTQIVMATHSPALVNRIDPSEIVVVERDPTENQSRAFRPSVSLVRRLIAETDYRLGELWFAGALGALDHV